MARGIGDSLTDAAGNCRRSEPGLGPLLERKLEAQKRTAQLQLEAVHHDATDVPRRDSKIDDNNQSKPRIDEKEEEVVAV